MGYTIDPNYEPKGVPLEEAIRQIVREEIAAHEERLRSVQKPLFIDSKDFAAKAISYLRADSPTDGTPPESQK